jgi:hypothetical protein|tara:strand:- start:528 stop:731 length:204 start_codon:yes stop_codon:yes gene_type:complete
MAKFAWAYVDCSSVILPSNVTSITATMNASIPASYNAVLYGPITIEDGATLTINEGASLKIVDIQDA